MGCTISKRTYAEGVRQAQAVACNPMLQETHQLESCSSLVDSVYENNFSSKAEGRNTGPTRTSSSSESDEESDVSTNEMDDEKCKADVSAARENRKAEEKEQAESRMIRMKARASRRSVSQKVQRKVELRAKRAHQKEASMQHTQLLDKIKETKKDENTHKMLRLASQSDSQLSTKNAYLAVIEKHVAVKTQKSFTSRRLDNNDGKVQESLDDSAKYNSNQQSPDVVSTSMQRLTRDLERRTFELSKLSTDELLLAGRSHDADVNNPDNDFGSIYIRSLIETTEVQLGTEPRSQGWRTPGRRDIVESLYRDSVALNQSSPGRIRQGGATTEKATRDAVAVSKLLNRLLRIRSHLSEASGVPREQDREHLAEIREQLADARLNLAPKKRYYTDDDSPHPWNLGSDSLATYDS